jgi:hypothetical protein
MQNSDTPARQALEEDHEGANLSSQAFDFGHMTLGDPASDVHDIVCGPKHSLHVLSQGVESVPAYTVQRLNGLKVINQTFESGNE